MIYVPEKFQRRHPFKYPSDNENPFEEWYYDNYDFKDGEREYLPIFWTGYYIRANFAKNKPAMVDLQKYLDTLDRSKRYYTLIQYDGGLQHDLSHLDIKVFSMSGGRTDYPLPLISVSHNNLFPLSPRKPYKVNFIGKITHPIRETILRTFPLEMYYHFSTTPHKLHDYCRIISQSTFTLAPRGFGPTSFRIQESLQYGSIPVYISDEWVIPHNIPFTDYGVLIDAADAHRVHDILMSIPAEEIKRKKEAIPEIYKKYFTYEGCRERIKEALSIATSLAPS